MILRCVLAAAIGFAQVFLIALQTRQLAAGGRGARVFVTALGISGVWVAGVTSVAAHPLTAPFYVVSAAAGTLVAARVRLRPHGRRARSHLLPRSLKRKP